MEEQYDKELNQTSNKDKMDEIQANKASKVALIIFDYLFIIKIGTLFTLHYFALRKDFYKWTFS